MHMGHYPPVCQALRCLRLQASHARTASAAEPLQRAPPQSDAQPAPGEPASPDGGDSALQKAGSADMDSFATLKRIAEALGEVDREELSEAGLLDVRTSLLQARILSCVQALCMRLAAWQQPLQQVLCCRLDVGCSGAPGGPGECCSKLLAAP